MNKKPSREQPAQPSRHLDSKLDAMIGAKLRTFYDGLMAEPVPERIVELIARLDARERRESNAVETSE